MARALSVMTSLALAAALSFAGPSFAHSPGASGGGGGGGGHGGSSSGGGGGGGHSGGGGSHGGGGGGFHAAGGGSRGWAGRASGSSAGGGAAAWRPLTHGAAFAAAAYRGEGRGAHDRRHQRSIVDIPPLYGYNIEPGAWRCPAMDAQVIDDHFDCWAPRRAR